MEEADESRKGKHPYSEIYENAPQILPFSDELDGGDAELEIEEEMVIAVMKRLEEEISSASASPSTSSRFLNPNGGSDESCGSSFSDSASTVMASALHTCELPGAMTCLVCGPWPWAVGSGEVAAAAGPSRSEAGGEEDEWLARVLGGPGFELEECFLAERGVLSCIGEGSLVFSEGMW